MNQTTRSTTSSYPLQQSRSTTAGPLHEVHYRSGSTTANRRQREDVWSSAVSADRAAGGVGCVVARGWMRSTSLLLLTAFYLNAQGQITSINLVSLLAQ